MSYREKIQFMEPEVYKTENHSKKKRNTFAVSLELHTQIDDTKLHKTYDCRYFRCRTNCRETSDDGVVMNRNLWFSQIDMNATNMQGNPLFV